MKAECRAYRLLAIVNSSRILHYKGVHKNGSTPLLDIGEKREIVERAVEDRWRGEALHAQRRDHRVCQWPHGV
jgi:hypothetical protein